MRDENFNVLYKEFKQQLKDIIDSKPEFKKQNPFDFSEFAYYINTSSYIEMANDNQMNEYYELRNNGLIKDGIHRNMIYCIDKTVRWNYAVHKKLISIKNEIIERRRLEKNQTDILRRAWRKELQTLFTNAYYNFYGTDKDITKDVHFRNINKNISYSSSDSSLHRGVDINLKGGLKVFRTWYHEANIENNNKITVDKQR